MYVSLVACHVNHSVFPGTWKDEMTSVVQIMTTSLADTKTVVWSCSHTPPHPQQDRVLSLNTILEAATFWFLSSFGIVYTIGLSLEHAARPVSAIPEQRWQPAGMAVDLWGQCEEAPLRTCCLWPCSPATAAYNNKGKQMQTMVVCQGLLFHDLERTNKICTNALVEVA